MPSRDRNNLSVVRSMKCLAHGELPLSPKRLATKQTMFRTGSDPSDILPLVTVLGAYYVADEVRVCWVERFPQETSLM